MDGAAGSPGRLRPCASQSPERAASSAPRSPDRSPRPDTRCSAWMKWAREPSDFTRLDLTDYGQVVDALSGVDDRMSGFDAVVHLAALPVGRARAGLRHVPQQHDGDLQRLPGRAAGRHPSDRLRVERDAPRPPVRDAAAVRPGRRGVRLPPRDHVLARQAPRRGARPQADPLGSRAQHHGAEVLERHGARRLSRLRRRSRATRHCGAGTCGATSTPATAPRQCCAPSTRIARDSIPS